MTIGMIFAKFHCDGLGVDVLDDVNNVGRRRGIHVNIYMYICICIWMSIYVYAYVYAYVYVYMYISHWIGRVACIYMFICISV